MKINRKNPLHWIYLGVSALWILLAIFTRPFLRSAKRPRVVLYGHKLNGNLLALKRELNSGHHGVDAFFLTLDPVYYYHSRNATWLLALNPLHVFMLARTACIVSDHGLHTLELFQKLTNMKFADVWHGVPFKGFVPEDFCVQHRYDQIWVSSASMKKIYEERFGFSRDQLHVTGYGRIDTLLTYAKNPSKQIELLGLDPQKHKRVMFAPTWRQELPADAEGGRVASLQEMLVALDRFAHVKNVEIIFRPHLNFASDDIEIGPNVRVLDSVEFTDTESILSVSDCLITDWSSIAFDFMALGRPLVFIDCDPPYRHGLTLPARYRAGATIKSVPGLQNAVSKALNNPASYQARYAGMYREAREIAWGDTLDGQAVIRYTEALFNLLPKASENNKQSER